MQNVGANFCHFNLRTARNRVLFLVAFLFSLGISSCKKETPDYRIQYIGDWTFHEVQRTTITQSSHPDYGTTVHEKDHAGKVYFSEGTDSEDKIWIQIGNNAIEYEINEKGRIMNNGYLGLSGEFTNEMTLELYEYYAYTIMSRTTDITGSKK